jgi:hypothetical protein
MMISGSQIKEWLARYLDNEISFSKFEEWFIPNTREIRKTRSEAAISLRVF